MSSNKEILEILKFLKNSGLNEVEIKTKSYELKIKRETETKYLQQSSNTSPILISPPSHSPSQESTIETQQLPVDSTGKKAKLDSDKKMIELKSPMIGTFYRSQNPETPNYVEVGETVQKGDTICIVEAMKLFNEIEAEHTGKIVEVLVENASPVEYGQSLFLIEPL